MRPWAAVPETVRVLVVDDEEVDRLSVRRLLRHQPMELREAVSGAGALAAVEDNSPIDCVLLDYYLPDAEACELIPLLLERRPHLAIVALTGLGDEAIAVALMKAGARDYLTKGALDGARLAAAIRSAVGQAAADARAAELGALRLRHAKRLEHLMDAAQHLVGSLDVGKLAANAAATARDVLQATSVFVRLHEGNDDVIVHEGEDINGREPTSSSTKILRATGETSRPHRLEESTTVLFTMWLSPAENGRRSVLSVRVPKGDPSEMVLDEALFHQLGVLLTRSLESSHLMRSVHRAVKARDEVMAVVSHDLRGPLGSALLGCSLLGDDVGAEGKMVLARMDKGLRHMQRLVDDLVLVIKAERGEIPLQRENVALEPLLLEAKAIVDDAARESGVTVLVHPPTASSPMAVPADRHRMLQVLSNLLQNGIKFTPSGGSVTLSVEGVDDVVEISVQDTGTGISPEKQGRIFDRFYTDDQRERGLGLGLAIAHGIVQLHAGTIGVDSQPGAGARFWVRLPREPQATENIGKEGA